MSVSKAVSLIGEFQVNGERIKNLELDASHTKIRFNEESGIVVVVGQDNTGKTIKGLAYAEEGLLQQLDHLGSKATKDTTIRMPKAFA